MIHENYEKQVTGFINKVLLAHRCTHALAILSMASLGVQWLG